MVLGEDGDKGGSFHLLPAALLHDVQGRVGDHVQHLLQQHRPLKQPGELQRSAGILVVHILPEELRSLLHQVRRYLYFSSQVRKASVEHGLEHGGHKGQVELVEYLHERY